MPQRTIDPLDEIYLIPETLPRTELSRKTHGLATWAVHVPVSKGGSLDNAENTDLLLPGFAVTHVTRVGPLLLGWYLQVCQ